MTTSVSLPRLGLHHFAALAASVLWFACTSIAARAGGFEPPRSSHAQESSTYEPLGTLLEQKVEADDGVADDSFSYSVAVSGNLAVIGAPYAAIGGVAGQGAVYVFTNSGGTWSQLQKLSADDGGEGDEFGFSVSISGDQVVIGSPYAAIGANGGQGAAYVFDGSGGSFVQAQKLSADDGDVSNNFGWSVSMEGNTAVISAPSAVVGSNTLQGKAYVFSETGGIWGQGQTLVADDGTAFASFGYSVSLDGSNVIVGAQGEAGYFGAAYVFDGSDSTWTQSAKLLPDDGTAGEFFGISVAISGSNAVVGAYYQNVDGASHQGSAYVFSNAGGSWAQAQKLTASDGVANDRFGLSVALDGSTAVVGSYLADVGGIANTGAAYVFAQDAGTWIETNKLVASDRAENDHFGNAVSASGSDTLVGAFDAGVQGAAYFFTQPGDDTIFADGFDSVP